MAAIESRMPPPKIADLPDEIPLAADWKRILLDEQGVHVTDRKGGTSYLWSDVLTVDVIQAASPKLRVDRIDLVLSAKTINFGIVKGKSVSTWKKSFDAAVVAEFLRRHLPEERFNVSHHGQALANRALAERLAAESERGYRELKWCFGVCGSVLLGMASWIALNKQDLYPLILLIPCSPMLWLWVASKRHTQRWRAYLDGDEWRSKPPPGLRI